MLAQSFGGGAAARTSYGDATDHRGARHLPGTAGLSKLFYERFGETARQRTRGLVQRCGRDLQIGSSRLNEVNFARFDAKS
jgi:hypothetical protein